MHKETMSTTVFDDDWTRFRIYVFVEQRWTSVCCHEIRKWSYHDSEPFEKSCKMTFEYLCCWWNLTRLPNVFASFPHTVANLRMFYIGMFLKHRATYHLNELLGLDNMRNEHTMRINFQSFKIESVFRLSFLCFFLALILLLFSNYLNPKIVFFLLFYRIISSVV